MEKRIIEILKENKESFVSGEDLSVDLKVSRTAVWKHIQNLKELGYEIVAQPHLGYQLLSVPDKLLPDEIDYKLKTKFLGRKVFSYVSTESTNDIAYTLAEQSAPEGTMIISEKQTSGRGRLGRNWASPAKSGLYFSLVLRPNISPNEAGRVTLMASIAIAKTLREKYHLDALIKWPNDVYVGKEKICGILTEMNAEIDRINFIILGIGINVNTDPSKLPKNSTSIKSKAKKAINRVELLKELLLELEKDYIKVKNLKFKEIIEAWRNLSMTLGNRVKIKLRKQNIEGQAMDIDDSGALIVRDDFGFLHHILSGDVTLYKHK